MTRTGSAKLIRPECTPIAWFAQYSSRIRTRTPPLPVVRVPQLFWCYQYIRHVLSGIMALWIQTGDTYSPMVNDLISWLSECMQIVGYILSFSEEHIATTYGTTQTSVYIEFGHTPGILKCDHIDYTIWHDHFSPKSIDTPWLVRDGHIHYNDFIMSAVTSQITGVSIVLSSIFSGADQRKHQSSASLAFVRGNPLVTDGFPLRSVDNAENVSIWWRHHDSLSCEYSLTPAPPHPPFQCQCNFIVWIH